MVMSDNNVCRQATVALVLLRHPYGAPRFQALYSVSWCYFRVVLDIYSG